MLNDEILEGFVNYFLHVCGRACFCCGQALAVVYQRCRIGLKC